MLSHEDEGMMGQFVVFDNSIAVDESENDFISIYPNPVLDKLQIEGLTPANIMVYTTTGQLLFTRETTNSEEQLSFNGYAPGVYYLKIRTMDQVLIYKVLKK
jgi:hypothetical protein